MPVKIEITLKQTQRTFNNRYRITFDEEVKEVQTNEIEFFADSIEEGLKRLKLKEIHKIITVANG